MDSNKNIHTHGIGFRQTRRNQIQMCWRARILSLNPFIFSLFEKLMMEPRDFPEAILFSSLTCSLLCFALRGIPLSVFSWSRNLRPSDKPFFTTSFFLAWSLAEFFPWRLWREEWLGSVADRVSPPLGSLFFKSLSSELPLKNGCWSASLNVLYLSFGS